MFFNASKKIKFEKDERTYENYSKKSAGTRQVYGCTVCSQVLLSIVFHISIFEYNTIQYDTPYRFSITRGIQGELLSAIICLDCPLTEKKPLHITMKPVYITNSNLH
jgi:hypothetical protein